MTKKVCQIESFYQRKIYSTERTIVSLTRIVERIALVNNSPCNLVYVCCHDLCVYVSDTSSISGLKSCRLCPLEVFPDDKWSSTTSNTLNSDATCAASNDTFFFALHRSRDRSRSVRAPAEIRRCVF